jgi:cyclic beta-1,2-glucan synthetase
MGWFILSEILRRFRSEFEVSEEVSESDEPIRSEIFSITRLESHAESLARAQNVTNDPRIGRDLTPRIRENQKVLETAYNHIIQAIEERRAITPAAEWLADNFHIVRAQLKDIQDHLPKAYYQELPKIAEGPLAGYPRVFGIAWGFVAHTDSRFDPELLKIFISGYQKVQPLTIGELWAIPITLRLVLIENFRRLGARILNAQKARRQADLIADSLLGVGVEPQRAVDEVLKSLQAVSLQRSFAVQLLHRLRFQEARVGALFQFIDQRLAANGHSIEEYVTDEHNSQSAANITARNIVTSARLISAFDWTDFFEQNSIVDKILRDGSDFGLMDFATRDRYRHRIEELSRYSPLSELEVATAALSDPGNNLIGAGKQQFENKIKYEPPLRAKIVDGYLQNGTVIYLGFIFLLTVLLAALAANQHPLFVLPLVLLITSEIALMLVNRWTISLLGPKHLPRLNFETGIPDHLKTFIVVPTLLTDASKIKSQLEQLEIYYLSNQDDNIYLGLLSDFGDAKSEVTVNDALLLETAQHELTLLNLRHPVNPGQNPRFYIFHRRRLLNKKEGVWMGWERKRGKLHEFNRLLLGATDTSFAPYFNSDIGFPKDIRYVITLDADTMLPRGSAHKLVGTMAHPLHRPIYDEKLGRVTSGYGILQPRITPSLASLEDSTVFRKLSASRSGIDPYAFAVSDVYQDLFQEGSFIGKGIYDVRIFERAIENKIPENSILSHDLFEGNLARCGFLSDVEFFEDLPSHTGVATLRSHRWTRGDWQLLPWIFGSRGRCISFIGKWKMFDNLRRSLIAPAAFLLFLFASLFPMDQAWPLYLLLAINFLAPALITFFADIFSKREGTLYFHQMTFAYQELRLGLGRTLMSLVLLPLHAWTTIDAIARVFYRMGISGKKMLEWTTAAQAKAAANYTLKSFVISMWGAVFLSLIGIFTTLIYNNESVYLPLTVFAIWLVSPVFAKYFSQPPKIIVNRPIKKNDIQLLHLTARRIWRFFATFVTAEDNYLPPDNFQEDPVGVVAHRSSPTNFGLYLLSVFAAKDFGWIGVLDSVERLENTLKSLIKLPRHQGHFYNWYETTEPRALEPRYISSVDNGNLVGHLYVVAQGCEEILQSKIEIPEQLQGVFETSLLLDIELKNYKQNHTVPGEAYEKTKNALVELLISLHKPSHRIDDQFQHWENLRSQAALLAKHARAFAGDPIVPERKEILEWSRALQHDIQSFAKDYFSLVSWTEFRRKKLPADATVESQLWWESTSNQLSQMVPLGKQSKYCGQILADAIEFKKREKAARREVPDFLDSLLDSLEQAISNSRQMVQKLIEIKKISRQLIADMDFNLLYDRSRKLFSIGLRVGEDHLDPSYYDLLASEARLTSFIAIAKGDVSVSHWFNLSRSLVSVGTDTALVSWSGSMFEYLMPCLVMRSPKGSLLDDTCERVVRRQISYGQEKNVPWGISESAYNKRDLHLTYQYSNFGVPDLGLKRGLGADLVIAPYASLMGTMYEPALAAENLRQIQNIGGMGPYGFYEAIDFTPSRLPADRPHAVVKAYMAHHQGMALVALANVFKGFSMQRRFHADPSIQATELLLQERTPMTVGILTTPKETSLVESVKEPIEHVSRRYHTVNRPIPTTQMLSNGAYSVMVTSAGSGFSRVRDLAVTRWREDVTRDHFGYFFYIKDRETKNVWSAGYQPVCLESESYEVSFAEDRVRIIREDFDIVTELEIFVSPEENAEVRRITLMNRGSSERELEVTSYAEVVLNAQNADVAHPAFSNLFVETECVPELSTLIASRRPRSDKDKRLWMMHSLRADRHSIGTFQYETSRANFIGRNRDVKNPIAIFERETLSGTVGPVLDPIFSLRTGIRLKSGESAQLIFSTGMADSREAIENMSEKFSDTSIFQRASDLAWTQAQVKLYHLGIEPDEAHLYQRLATRLLYMDPSLRAPSDIVAKNVKDVSGLWAHGISGDHPIILVRIDDMDDRNLIRQLLKAQIYFATKAFITDLVILNERGSSYSQELQQMLQHMAQAAHVPSALPYTSGKVFVLRGDLLSEADHVLLASEARAILSSRHGSLSDQVKRTQMQTVTPVKLPPVTALTHSSLPIPKLEFFNGYGGFSSETGEYVIALGHGQMTPAPWINVIANPSFGFQVSESGSGYTWASNSRENQLTPWSNDPVSDPPGETFYIADMESGAVWSPTLAPIRVHGTNYLTYHGAGYSRFEVSAYGIFSELKQFVIVDKPVKVSRLTLENRSKNTRRFSISGYIEWVLGFARASMVPTLITEFDEASQSVFAFNPRNPEHGKKIAFSAMIQKHSSFTCDRTEFIGRNSSLATPVAVFQNKHLSGRSGGVLDPCTALQTQIEIKPGARIEVSFIMGQAENRESARSLVNGMRSANLDQEFTRVEDMWKDLLEKVQVETPDRSFDLVINQWFLYQTIVCRLWARAAFYQAGGAYGFRDQLQDVMAVIMTTPLLAREQILRAASRQFIEGDVQHWWHPPFGRGVRTHFSDDLLWLPFVVSHYLKVTKDVSILDEVVSFIEGPELPLEKEDSYYIPEVSAQTATLYEHCARTMDYSLRTGEHGLPLMGTGDWNDGMNHIGIGGRGESVWMAWFLITNLNNFAPVAQERGENERSQIWIKHARSLLEATETNAWDGSWYRRAFFDDGTPLGTKDGDECQIDSLAQTWSIISSSGKPERAASAMQAVYERLVKSDEEMVLLFAPPFDKTKLDPGYIKGYLPGVRENGGQYTHAASWVVIATALLGDGKKAFELFSYLNPIHHSKDQAGARRYRIEPYVLAGDVYSQDPNTGRGGWSWYTGAAGWMYRAGIEYILGMQVEGNKLTLKPCVPPDWKEFKITYRYGKSTYVLNVTLNSSVGKSAQTVDLVDDGKTYELNLELGP